jgi:hypothetical protein
MTYDESPRVLNWAEATKKASVLDCLGSTVGADRYTLAEWPGLVTQSAA